MMDFLRFVAENKIWVAALAVAFVGGYGLCVFENWRIDRNLAREERASAAEISKWDEWSTRINQAVAWDQIEVLDAPMWDESVSVIAPMSPSAPAYAELEYWGDRDWGLYRESLPAYDITLVGKHRRDSYDADQIRALTTQTGYLQLVDA